MFAKLSIHEFRLFDEQEILLGKYITVLAGRNSTGKSTILGMLGNSSEIKKKTGATYDGNRFRAEFSEIFKGSKQFDHTASNRFEISIIDKSGNEQVCRFRTSWQRYSSEETAAERFRIIPKRITSDGKETEAKLEYPVLYLGLSRLFPIGESADDSISNQQLRFVNDEHKKWFIDNYSDILSLQDSVSIVSNYSLRETDKKKGVGITTNKYDYLTNSSGQDNLGQILLGILSFRNLHEKMDAKWDGGLLLIDEIDATLHPAAQNRLLDLLYKSAKEYGFQVVFTTHSLSLLKYICSKTDHNSEQINNYELYYFTTANRKLSIGRNVAYMAIENDLMIQSIVQNNRRIKIYTEDSEARWFLAHLIPNNASCSDLLDTKVACTSIISMYIADPGYFGNVMVVLDGDVEDRVIEQIPSPIRNHNNNILRLPGTKRPESVIYEYLMSLGNDHAIWQQVGNTSSGFSWQYFNDHGPDSKDYDGKDRDRYKKWFNEHILFFESYHIIQHWIHDNPAEYKKFLNEFISSYNTLASRMMMPKIETVDPSL